ncbi:Uncharacterized protein Fot_51377 [Forsythia ovata]|uniref:Uncharacterized protein n=1 Tax=Forsythia ovata TaxID=205694 RepID=A0ABD1PV96_9LAMI
MDRSLVERLRLRRNSPPAPTKRFTVNKLNDSKNVKPEKISSWRIKSTEIKAIVQSWEVLEGISNTISICGATKDTVLKLTGQNNSADLLVDSPKEAIYNDEIKSPFHSIADLKKATASQHQ